MDEIVKDGYRNREVVNQRFRYPSYFIVKVPMVHKNEDLSVTGLKCCHVF